MEEVGIKTDDEHRIKSRVTISMCASVLRTLVSLRVEAAGDTDYTAVERSAAPSEVPLAGCPTPALLACIDEALRGYSLRRRGGEKSMFKAHWKGKERDGYARGFHKCTPATCS